MPETDTPTLSPYPERLVTIESQAEFDLLTGERQERLFLKLYVAARTSGLLAAISDRDWKTLCVLGTYMDASGFCFPSQAELARAIGCSRQMVSERVNSLARFRFQGQPVLIIVPPKHKQNGRFAHNGYRVLPLARLSIFDEGQAGKTTTKKKQGPKHTVSRKPDTVEATVSSATGTVQLDTNKNQNLLNEIALSNIRMRTRAELNVDNFDSNAVQPHRTSAFALDTGGEFTQNQPTTTIVASNDNAPVALTPRLPGELESVGAVLKRGRGRPPKQPYDEARLQIQAYLKDFARELGDRAPLTASVSRAYHLYQESGVPMPRFIDALYQARAKTQERSAAIKSRPDPDQPFAPKAKMAYYFAVLEDELGLRPDNGQRPDRASS